LIRTNGFALLAGGSAAKKAASIANRIDRYRSKVVVTRLEAGSTETVVCLALDDGSGTPVVHGDAFREGRWWGGEYSMIGAEDGKLYCERDAAGTRPLYAPVGGAVMAASDHRFLPGGARFRLLEPGERLILGEGTSKRKNLGRAEVPSDLGDASEVLAKRIDESVKTRVEGFSRVGVAFSGGLDSSVLAVCAAKYADVVLCSVYREGAHDQEAASVSAGMLGLCHVTSRLDKEDSIRELKRMELGFTATPMDRALWCIYSAASKSARESGAGAILLGQLADELFGGYRKYAETLNGEGPSAASRQMEDDVRGCGTHGFIRDEQACSRFLEPRFPFADRPLMEFARGTPMSFKIGAGSRKVILREAAKILGVPEQLAESPKKAAQYSSGILKLVA
jgi:asparagine synthase (glutamine-hydrolysing)